tara:strand:+ start:47 stop:220 length:174 start_codon:yes stop_codon:yes gene_type:complete
MKYTFNNRKEALQKVDAIPTPHSHTINHYAEEDKYIVNIEWKGTNLWKSKVKKNDKN